MASELTLQKLVIKSRDFRGIIFFFSSTTSFLVKMLKNIHNEQTSCTLLHHVLMRLLHLVFKTREEDNF